MGLRRAIPEPALFVPDYETWLVFAGDAAALAPAEDPGRARLLVLPHRLPRELGPAVREAWQAMPGGRAPVTYDAALHGVGADAVLRGHDAHDHGDHEPHGARDAHAHGDDEPHGTHDAHDHGGHGHEGHGEHDHGGHDHGGHDHGDMMAITGEPSADGLVMESMDVEAGPVGVGLPGGLVVRATLDGDVVAACEVDATLAAPDDGPGVDVWSATAWAVAEQAARERAVGVQAAAGAWINLAAVEIERAVSHLAWLHALCRLLGWEAAGAHVRAVLRAALDVRHVVPAGLATPDLPDASGEAYIRGLRRAETAATALLSRLERSRALRRRTHGLGGIGADDARRQGLVGPVARASGVADDARTGDPGYAGLGFEPLVREEGDAHARVLVRAAEVPQSVRLAAAALERAREHDEDVPTFRAGPRGAVEAARGPVLVDVSAGGGRRRRVPGAGAVREAAGRAAVGREWAAALVAVASFDVSPWRVGS